MTRRGSLGPARGPLSIALTVAAATLAAPHGARAETSYNITIRDLNGDNILEPRAGQPYVTREDLAAAKAGRHYRRGFQATFAQFSDTHVVDEESPLRLEFLDRIGAPLTSAYRPQDGLSAQVVNEMVAQIRASASPITKKTAEFVITTGDNSDNSQLNEVRAFIDVMDGGGPVETNSGQRGNCGLPNTTRRYDGVRGNSVYYEPDRSAAAGEGADGDGYAPDAATNLSKVGRSSRLRDFPGLFEAMNKSFPAVGLGVPWYGAFGNHDGLIQGNAPRNAVFEAIATGCVKVTALSPAVLAQVQTLAAGGLTPAELAQAYTLILTDLTATIADPSKLGTLARIVPADPRRRPLTKVEYIRQHFSTRGLPVGHGFTRENLNSGMGNFAFTPKPGLRFIALDTINEAGYSDGNVDAPQFRWLHGELTAAEARSELIVVFAHHSLRTMNTPGGVPFPIGDGGGNPTPLVHFGLGANGSTADCPSSDASAEPALGETVRCLFLRHPGVIAYVSGHEHINRVTSYPRAGGGGFWEISTASHIDWPQQSRLIDILDNRDGSISIYATAVNHAGPARAETTVPTGTIDAEGVRRLAAISRELSFNDPQGDNGEDGRSDAEGGALDRNVELLIRHPYAR